MLIIDDIYSVEQIVKNHAKLLALKTTNTVLKDANLKCPQQA